MPEDHPSFSLPSGPNDTPFVTPTGGFQMARESVLPAPVLVVEDEPVFQQRLYESLIHLGYAPDALLFATSLATARARLAQGPVALALVDLMLPDGNGRELIAELRSQEPDLGILVVTAWSSEDDILGALRAGATGYVLKEREDFEVMLSIRSVLRGGAPIDPFIARRILQQLPDHTPLESGAGEHAATPPSAELPTSEALSKREREILQMVAGGFSNREISERLFLSYYTVETHVKRIYRKLAVSSRAMAVRTALERGEIE